MALGNWNHTGDYYVSQKFGDDANDGSTSSPFQTIQKAIAVARGQDYQRVVVKPGRYLIPETLNYNDPVIHFIADGNVQFRGSGSGSLQIPLTTIGYGMDNCKVEDFVVVGRTSANHSFISKIYDFLTVTGAQYSTFYDINRLYVTSGNASFPFNAVEYQNCNFIKATIARVNQIPIFKNCFFDAQSTFIKDKEAYPETVEFINCTFQVDGDNQFSFLGQDISTLDLAADDRFINCEVIDGSPGFNKFEGVDPQYWDLTLKYSTDINVRSPLYKGNGVFVGPHKFATPVERTHPAFAQSATTGPYTDDDSPILDNVTFNQDTGLIELIDLSSTGRIRSSGTNPLSFGGPKVVDTPFRFAGTSFHHQEFIDDVLTNDRATYRLRIKDLSTNNWSAWYTMTVNQPWQKDGNNRGNGNPYFDISTAQPLRCMEYQIDLTLNPQNI
ncbi:MAG TPA: hypothetical protein DCE41_32780 [Cytophagales bacterium]|nr:hypothetical protein [Cytophagales bacterium]HAA18086.1 hypothetical protein [Cytophagales bacterium]HAP59871.1 hypothetical protein [Cytophagales bacterium]